MPQASCPTPHASLAVAVSGGADSMALALLAKGWAEKNQIPLTALTVDHGLRPDSAAEARQVEAWMTARGIAHRTLTWRHGELRGNVPQAARQARYRLMTEWCRENGVENLLLAHHADDQAETLLMRLKRGSHVTGLSGMAPVVEMHGISILRPLLSVPKSELPAFCRAEGQEWLEDPTNGDARFERNALRQALSRLPECDALRRDLARSAEVFLKLRRARERECDAFLERYAVMAEGEASLSLPALEAEPEMALAALSRLLTRIGGRPQPPRFSDLERLYAALLSRESRTLHGCLLRVRDEGVIIRPEYALKPYESLLYNGESV